jgi:hypothetical protein
MPAAKLKPSKTFAELDLAEILGTSWQGFFLYGGTNETDQQGTFAHVAWRKHLSAGDFRALFYQCQQVEILEHEVKRLKAEVQQAEEAADAAENAAEFYRRELRAASRFALMFSPIQERGGDGDFSPSCSV